MWQPSLSNKKHNPTQARLRQAADCAATQVQVDSNMQAAVVSRAEHDQLINIAAIAPLRIAVTR
jgi:hypothetical protein